MSKILVQDRVTILRTKADEWLDKWHREYLPNAQERGITLNGI